MKRNTANILERRALAFIIDAPIIAIISMTIFYIYSVFFFSPDSGNGFLNSIFTLISFTTILLKDVFGNSLGKRILKLNIKPTNSGCKYIALRKIARNITTLIWPIEAMAIIVSGKRISDRLLGLNVVEVK